MDAASWFDALQDRTLTAGSEATRRAHPEERRMNGSQIVAFLNERRLCGLATVRPDGRPHLTTNAFVLHEIDLWLPAMEGTTRNQNLTQTAYASVIVMDGQASTYTMVTAEGEVTLIEKAPEVIEDLHWQKQESSVGWIACWIRMRPGKLFTFAGEKSAHSFASGLLSNLF